MNVWCHLPTIFKRRQALRTAGLITLCVAITTTLFFTMTARAATGVNQTLSFQGRLQNSSGAVVPDGYYNIQFKLYQDGDGTTAGNTEGSPAGSLKWTEDYVNNNANQGVRVKSGYFSVNLGSRTGFAGVDWNQDTLWLSMNVAGTSAGCSDFDSCSPDGEMTPMKRLTAVPYAMQAQNANTVGGMNANDLIHNQNVAQQTASNFWLSGTGRADTSLLAPNFDTATSAALSIGTVNASGITIGRNGIAAIIEGDLQVADIDTATATVLNIGTANATQIGLNQDTVVAAGKTLSITGGATNTRPSSPTEGMIYYDTTTKQLLVYANDKWQSNGRAVTKIVAASNSPQTIKDGADYVTDGTGDQSEINSALTAAAGGKVYLAEGTYTINASISVPNNTTLAGSGAGTVITIPNGFNSSINAITNTTTGGSGSNITIQNMKLDGNRANQTSGTMHGIYFNGVGSGTGPSATLGGTVRDLQIANWRSTGILLDASSNNTISDNAIQNTGGSDAIRIENNISTANYLTNNNLAGSAISDAGTDTIYANQLDANGKLIHKSSGGVAVQTSTNNSTAFQVQNTAGTSAFTVDTTNNSVLVAGTLDTTTATTLSIGTATATAINIGTTSDSILTTVNGRALVKSTAGNDSTTAFQVQNASSTALLTADTLNMQVIIGSGGDTITLSSSGISFAGTARGTKQIRLAAEYQNTVLDNGATGNNTGTMLSSTDITNRMNFYRWQATSGTAQTYDIVTQVPIPQDFSAWAASNPLSITSRTSNTSNGSITMELRDSTGTVQCNFTGLTMGSTNTWITNTPNCLSSGTYTSGDYLTIRLRMSSRSNANTDVSNITLNYLSNK